MVGQQLAILGTGLVSSVGTTAQATTSAFRAGVTNPSQTRFLHGDGNWVVGHQVPLPEPWRGKKRLVKMAAMAIAEALGGARVEGGSLPLLLCLAELERPCRLPSSDAAIFAELEDELKLHFHPTLSALVPHGRVSVLLALSQARRLVAESGARQVLVAATDSLLESGALATYSEAGRLLARRNSNGFIPGEAAGALLVGPAVASARELRCVGIGQSVETATVMSEEPLRATGLEQAIREALVDAREDAAALDFRITDNSGEHYYFKEAALALGRVLRTRKPEFDLWQPAEVVGEVGAAIGAVMVAVADDALRKAYAPGPRTLLHTGNDAGRRVAAVLCAGGAA